MLVEHNVGAKVEDYADVFGDMPMDTMTPAEFFSKMKQISMNGDEEVAHVEADDLICGLLRQLGYGDGVDVFEDMPKWYA
jgi:hypothetical protein